MTYPLSTQVSAGQPTLASHYNSLRKDALNLGQADADGVKLAALLANYQSGVALEYLATNRVRVPFVTSSPPTLMVNGYMLKAAANVDLAAGLISGTVGIWYIFAVRTLGSSTFTLTANTSATEGTDQRIIGEGYFDGSDLTQIRSYFVATTLPTANYDSGWFACLYNSVYTKAHGLGVTPRLVTLLHSNNSTGSSEIVPISVVCTDANLQLSPVGVTVTSVILSCAASNTAGTCYSSRRTSASGYYRILAWI